ncbi:MAG TPA: LuxR C-terminal-related transcriptional regulator [Anaerolineales bacterium]|nr:LuxR C-terminal-related transcriptional regulator [Anaerolineales bacterium]
MDQLLTTKLYIPQLSVDLVPRPRLYERLDECLTRKLTLVSASAGFGKSTLLASWLFERDQPAAWLSLDQGDNDPVRFWTYLIAAIQTIHQETGEEARQIVSMPQLRNNELVAISLINDISQLPHDLIVVLDDYHLIEAEQVHAGLSYLLEHQPPNLHFILSTRVDPSISLARLRAHSQLIEIRAEDLQFSTEEAATLLNEKMGLNLRPEHIEALNKHIENWIVGLQLAALSLKGQSSYDTFIEEFTGGHQFILDYLIEEVLVRLPDKQRGLMLRTSILERFCGNLCRAVTGDPASGHILDEIRKSNLFLIPLDTHGRWFRYHHLFAEVLYALLEQDHPDEIEALHLKAAAWFESEGHPSEAVDHALRSGNMFQAREMFIKHWMPFLHRGEVATVLRWLEALPDEMKAEDPSLALAHCWALFLSWQNSEIGLHLERASNAYERLSSEGSLSSTQQNQIAAQLAMMRSVLARDRGDHASSVTHVEEATRLMPQDMVEGVGTAWNMLSAARAGAGDFEGAIQAYERGIALSHAEGNLIGAYGCTYGQVMYMLVQGRLNEADGLCRSSIDRAIREGHGDFPATGWLHIAMARVKLERGRLDEAEVHLRDGLRIARPGGFSEAVRSGRYLRAHLAAARGDLDAATDIFQDTARVVNAMAEPYLIGELNGQWVALCLKAGDLDAAREKLQILKEKSMATQHANLLLWWRSLFPRLLCAEERFDEALTALDESIRRARAANSNGELIRLLALQALALDALGDRMPARSALREALTLGAPDGYIWRWLDVSGPRLESLLRDLRDEHNTPQAFHPYLDSLLDACRSAFWESTQPQPGVLPDTLTLRELEIMRLICKGYSNSKIASELVVTINTIKKHTSNIYGKLGVSSRTQAIARARELNLL